MNPLNSGPIWSQILWGAVAGIAILWFFGKLGSLFAWFFSAADEAKEHNKRIEFGSMIAAILAFLISVAAFVVALYGRDDLDARITKLEQASSAVKPSATPAVKQ